MNEKYGKKFDSKSNKTRQKKKRQYKEFKPESGFQSIRDSDSKANSQNKSIMTKPNQSGSKSFKTPEKTEQKNTEEANPTFLLIKNLGPRVDESNVRELLGDHVVISSLKIVKNSNNVYVRFENPQQIHKLIQDHEKNPLTFRNKKVKMCLVNKLPLDLNQKSKICKYFILVDFGFCFE